MSVRRNNTSWAHGAVRRMLGLPFEAPRPVPYVLVKNESGALEIRFLEGRAKQKEIDAWYDEGVRGDIAEIVCDWIRPVRIKARTKSLVAIMKHRCEIKTAYRKLAHARTVAFESPYLVERDTFAVEGWLEQKRATSIPFNVISAKKLSDWIERRDSNGIPSIDNVFSNANCYAFDGNWVVVPDELSDKVIVEAIEGWYRDRFRLSRANRDWTPRVTVHVSRDVEQVD